MQKWRLLSSRDSDSKSRDQYEISPKMANHIATEVLPPLDSEHYIYIVNVTFYNIRSYFRDFENVIYIVTKATMKSEFKNL